MATRRSPTSGNRSIRAVETARKGHRGAVRPEVRRAIEGRPDITSPDHAFGAGEGLVWSPGGGHHGRAIDTAGEDTQPVTRRTIWPADETCGEWVGLEARIAPGCRHCRVKSRAGRNDDVEGVGRRFADELFPVHQPDLPVVADQVQRHSEWWRRRSVAVAIPPMPSPTTATCLSTVGAIGRPRNRGKMTISTLISC